MKKHLSWLRYVFLVLGFVLLALLIRKIGIDAIADSIRTIGWKFSLLFLIHFSWYAFYTLAWMQFFKQFAERPHFWELFRIKLAGEAVNVLTPINFLGGDPLRIYLLKHKIPTTQVTASVVVDRTLHSMATMSLVALGISLSLAMLNNQPSLIRFGFPGIILGIISLILFLLFHQHKGFFRSLILLLKKLRIKKQFSEASMKRFEELDQHIMEFYKNNHRAFFAAFFFHLAGRFLGIIEVYVIGKILSPNFTFFIALVLTAVAPMVNAVFTFIPGALGIMEGTFSGLLYMMGLNPAIGIAIQVAKRVRAGFWISAGLLCLNKQQRGVILNEVSAKGGSASGGKEFHEQDSSFHSE